MPLTTGTPKWQKIATFTLLVAIFLTVLFIYNRAGQTNAAVSATNSSVERTDCARQVNAEQSAVRDTATIADRAERRYLDSVLLDQVAVGPPSSEVTAQRIAEFSKLVRAADAADDAVKTLPDPAQEVERRCPG